MDPPQAHSVVEQFARALDRDDWAGAGALLAEDCEYHFGDGVVRGVEAVVACYRASSEKARRALEHVTYASKLERVHAAQATVLFVDHLEHAGQRHEFRCRQIFTVTGGRVARIARWTASVKRSRRFSGAPESTGRHSRVDGRKTLGLSGSGPCHATRFL